jgi:molybdopterin-guanine dinucleotide biosynthesis protein A
MAGVVGLILAGGLSRRMGGGDKSLSVLGGRTLLQRVTDRLAGQTDALLLNVNGDPARLGSTLTVVPDAMPDNPGPLAGLLAGLDHVAANRPWAEWVLAAPGDCPFLPPDLAARLLTGRGAVPAAIAASGGRSHPVIGLWRVALRGPLRHLLEGGERRAGRFAEASGAARVEWPAEPYDRFFNINTPDDLADAERIIARYPDA